MNARKILLKQFFFLLLFTTSSLFNTDIAANNGKILDVQDDARFSAPADNCEIKITFSIRMTKPFVPGSQSFQSLVPMYLRYHLENQGTETIPVYFDEFVDYGEKIDGRSIIEWRFSLSFDNQSTLPPSYTGTLVTDHPSIPGYHSFYPVRDYIAHKSFFPCHVFDHSFGTQTPPPGCELGETTPPRVYRSLISVWPDCRFAEEPIIDDNPFDIIDPFDGENEGEELPFHSNEKNLTSLQFQPNPFDSQLHLPFELKEAAAFEFQVFDATGKILHQEAKQQGAGAHQIELDTDNWPTGVYYAQVNTGSFSKSYRLVKIK